MVNYLFPIFLLWKKEKNLQATLDAKSMPQRDAKGGQAGKNP